MTHPNLEFMREYLDCWVTGNVDKALSMIADDVVTVFPGKNAVAGTYQGRDGFVALGEKMAKFGELTIDEFYDIAISDERAIVRARERFHRQDNTTIVERAVEYRIRDRKVIGIYWFEGHQHEVDAFFTAEPGNES